MISVSEFGFEQVQVFVAAAAGAGFKPKHFGELSDQPELLEKFLKVMSGESKIVDVEFIIDCDGEPYIPNTWEIGLHVPCDKVRWDLARMSLFQHSALRNKEVERVPCIPLITEELRSQNYFNANMLDFLLKHQFLIPPEWEKGEDGKPLEIFFPGTFTRRPVIFCT